MANQQDFDERLNRAYDFAHMIIPHVVQIAAGICANPDASSPTNIALESIMQVKAIYVALGFDWPELPKNVKEGR